MRSIEPAGYFEPPSDDDAVLCRRCQYELGEHYEISINGVEINVCPDKWERVANDGTFAPDDDDRTPSEARAEMRGDRI